MKKVYYLVSLFVLIIITVLIYSYSTKPKVTSLQDVIKEQTNDFTSQQPSKLKIFKMWEEDPTTSDLKMVGGNPLTINDYDQIETITNIDVSLIEDMPVKPAESDQYYMRVYLEGENGFMLHVSEEDIFIDKSGKNYKVSGHKNQLFDYLQKLSRKGEIPS